MLIKVLGSRGEIPATLPYHSKHSGVLIDDQLLLDLGEKEFLTYQPKNILITHFHPDHAYFVRRGKEEIPHTTATIWAPELPEQTLLKPIVKVIDQEVNMDSYTVIPIPTHHSKNVKSQAYLIKTASRSILYTGDLVWMDKQYHHLLGQLDLVITEGSFIRKGGRITRDQKSSEIYGHNGIPNLIDLFKNYTKAFLFIHFGSWFYEDTQLAKTKLLSLAKEKGVKVYIGYDSMKLIDF